MFLFISELCQAFQLTTFSSSLETESNSGASFHPFPSPGDHMLVRLLGGDYYILSWHLITEAKQVEGLTLSLSVE